jgi:phospho-N-acetylmuramoyl-pentapeptide-transferase
MLLWLLEHFVPLAEKVEGATSGDSHVFLTGRTAAAAILSFVMALILGPVAIHWLKARFRERIDSASERLNQLHAGKKDTPSMGGLFIMASIIVTTLLCADLTSGYVQVALFVGATYGALGVADDWIKSRTKRRGLAAKGKFVFQIAIGLIAGWWLTKLQTGHPWGGQIVWPIGNAMLPLGWLAPVWVAFVVSGCSNSVNLTDGLDGLAAGCLLASTTAVASLCYLAGNGRFADYLSIPFVPGCGEMTVLLGSMIGAVLGFLWYNCHPAKVFMGDAGSLPLGALLAIASLIAKQEFLLVVIGGVFVLETLSVFLQVGSRKLTGRKPLLCSPLHNHFVFHGDPETRIVTRFWIISVLCAILGLSMLKLR